MTKPLLFSLATLIIFSSFFIFKLSSVPKVQATSDCSTASSNTTATLRVSGGLLSSVDPNNLASFLLNSLTTTPTPYCLSGAPAAIPSFALQSYQDLKSLYVDQAKTITPTPFNGDTIISNPIQANGPLIYIISQGNLTLSGSNLKINGSKPVLIFVDRDLYINSNFINNNSSDKNRPEDPISGLMLIVQGNINIKQDVERVDAFMITYGNFCDSYDTSNSTCSNSNTQLTINGSVIAINPPQPTPSPSPPKFRRTYTTSPPSPAELLNYQAKYLVVFKNLLAKDLFIWNEVQ